MILGKKRKHNYIYQPGKLKLNQEEKENKINTHHWNAFETIVNSHVFNKNMLDLAYANKNKIVSINDKLWVAGTASKSDMLEDALYIPDWKAIKASENISNLVGASIGEKTTKFATIATEAITNSPETALQVGGYIGEQVGRKAKDYTLNKTKDLGDSTKLTRYGQLDDYMKTNPQVVNITSHSMGSNASFEWDKQNPNIIKNNVTYGAPMVSYAPLTGKEDDNLRYRTKYDPVSILDREAHTIDSDNPIDMFGNHSYSSGFESGYAQNTKLSDESQILIN